VSTLIGLIDESFEVKDSFDQVVEKVFPLNPPTSALEAREAVMYEGVDGERLVIFQSRISYVKELIGDE
jgi:hypothetical protein